VEDANLMNVVYEEVGPQTPRPVPCLRKRYDGSGLILSFPDPGHLVRRHSLNRLSAEVYELCNGDRRIDEIRTRMIEKYPGLPLPVLSQHVVLAIRLMQRKGILDCP
jgi:hypothetical protein